MTTSEQYAPEHDTLLRQIIKRSDFLNDVRNEELIIQSAQYRKIK